LNLCTGQTAKISDLFFGFKNKPHQFLGLYFIGLFIGFVWMIPYLVVYAVAIITDYIPVMVVLLVVTYLIMLIGSIITSLYLSQSIYLLLEFPERGVIGSIKDSAAMMKGNKRGYFYLSISFIGMILLGYCSAGIGFLWIFPYVRAVMTEYYLELKGRNFLNSPEKDEEVSFESVWNQENQ
jgi:uncharacterized membrane protein